MRNKQRAPNPQPDVHFRLTQSEFQHVKKVAKKRDRSVAYVISGIVREWLNKNEDENSEEANA